MLLLGLPINFFSHNEQTSEKAEKRKDRELAPTVFEGLNIVEDASERFVLELKNEAQFVEILLTDVGHYPQALQQSLNVEKGEALSLHRPEA
jgi:hypothetical protein